MKKIFWCGLFLAVLAGCSGPKYMGSAIEDVAGVEIVIINDVKTRSGFQKAMEDWLISHNYEYVVVLGNSKHDSDKISLEYIGLWSWDMAIFLADARITAYHKGQQVGEVKYKASNNLNFSKLGNGEKRVKHMMDVLFGKMTTNELNNTNDATKDKTSQDSDCDSGVEPCI